MAVRTARPANASFQLTVSCRVHLVLYGCVLNLVWSYTSTEFYSRDTKRVKIHIWGLLALDTAASAVSFGQAFWYGVKQNKSAFDLTLTGPLDCLPPILTGMSAIVVQLFLAERCFSLSLQNRRRRKWFMIPLTIACVISFCCSIIVSVFFVLCAESIDFGTPKLSSVYLINLFIGIWLWLGAIIDVSVTAALIVSLRRQITNFSTQTDSMLRHVIKVACQTALLTSVFSVMGAAMAVGFPPSSQKDINVSFAFNYPLPSLYTISFIVTIAARGHLQNIRDSTPSPTTYPYSTGGFTKSPATQTYPAYSPKFPKLREAEGEVGLSPRFASAGFDHGLVGLSVLQEVDVYETGG
ncbi:hypothetical protein RQP46_000723 [Phenoliferia psychrophenolica]